MSGTLQFDNTEVFTNPGVGTPFIELTSAPGVTGHRLYTEGANLFIRDTLNNSTIFGTAGSTGATGPRGLQGNPGIGINGQNGISGGSILILDSPSGSAPQSGDLIQIPGVTKTITSTASSGDVLMGTFTTPQNSTTSLLIISGIWRLNIFATTLSQLVRIYFSIYYTDSTGTSETLVVDGSSTSATLIGTSLQQYMCSVYFPETSLPTMSSRIRIKVFATFLGSDTITVNLGGNTVSYLNTTIQANTVPFNFTGEGQLMYISSSTVVGVPEMTYTKLTSTTNFRNLLIYNSTVGNAAWFSSLTVSSILANSVIANYISSLLLEADVFRGNQLTTSSIVSNKVSTLSLQTGLVLVDSLTTSTLVANNISSLSGQVGNLTVYNSTIGNVAWFSTIAASTMLIGTNPNNTFTFFSKNNTPYYSNTFSSFSLVGENLCNVFYVAKNGDDTLGDGSESRPFLTISTAVGQAPSVGACAVYVSPGTYSEYVVIDKPRLSLHGTTDGAKYAIGTTIDGSLTITNNAISGNEFSDVSEYVGLQIQQRTGNVSTPLITISDYAVNQKLFQVNLTSIQLNSLSYMSTHGLLISTFSVDSGGNHTRVNILNSKFSVQSVSSVVGLKGGMLWEMRDSYVQNIGNGTALEIVGGSGQIFDINQNTFAAESGSALTIDKLFSSFNYGFRRNIITANTNGATVRLTSNNGYTFGIQFPVPFVDNLIANTVVTGGNSLFEMTGSENYIDLTRNQLLLGLIKPFFTLNPAYIVRGNASNTIFHRNNTLGAPYLDTIISTVGLISSGMSTVMIPLFLDYIDPRLFISSLTTNNISSLRGQIGAFTVSSIVGQNISSIAGQVRNLTTSSIIANNISTLSEQVGNLTATRIIASSINGVIPISTGFVFGDYLYWNGSAWKVGDSNISLGGFAGQTTQATFAVAIGSFAGNSDQGTGAVAVGQGAALNNQAPNSIAIGNAAGSSNQSATAIAIGNSAGRLLQSTSAIAIGASCGYNSQGVNAIAIGVGSASTLQGTNTVSIGSFTGKNAQGINAIALGIEAGGNTQGSNSVAIGPFAGSTILGTNSIAIGAFASQSGLSTNTIVFNATGGTLNPQISSALYIAPIRNNVNANSLPLVYDIVAKEVTYTSVLTFSSLTVSSIVSNNISTLTERVGSLFATNIIASTINVSTINQTAPIGNTLTVDAVFGNDLLAAQNRYTMPFFTISAALSNATSGQNVVVRAGTYNETLVMPDGVSVTGAGSQCVVIQKLNVTSNTTLITMSTNTRLENVTAKLTTTSGVDLIGCYFPSGASITSKLRQTVWNISSATTSPISTICIYSPGITANTSTFVSANAISRTTLNVASGNSGLTRGILVNGPNRFAIRESIVYAKGISSIGIETNHPDAFADVKTTSVYGEAIDILRGQGNIELGFTNLQNGTCGTSSFSVVLEPTLTTFGVVGNLKTDHLYYIAPGVLSEATVDTILVGTLVEIPVTQNLILIAGTMIFSGTIPALGTITFNLYRRIGGVAPDILVYTLQLTESLTKVVNQQLSVEFKNGDTYYATLTTVGNPGTGTFTTTLSFY